MLHLHEVMPSSQPVVVAPGRMVAPASKARATAPPTLTLTFDERRRSRRLVRLDDGREASLRLPRGTILRHGDRLRAVEDGIVVEVRAAAESLSVGRTTDPHLLTRVAYHLGNRHIALEIGAGWVAYAHDHVLDDMVRGLGLTVATRQAPFEPEAGAFQHAAGGGHHHEHHDHEHGHDHHRHAGDGDGDGDGDGNGAAPHHHDDPDPDGGTNHH